MTVLTIPSRFNGPAGVGNGGYVCGRIAAYVDGPATVTLRRPPPLDTPMEAERDDEGSVRVRHGRTLVGEAAPAPAGPPEIAVTVSPAEADAVAGGARYFRKPVFPDCFVCGINRRPGDGLRIFPGPVTGLALWAAPWTPDPSVAGPDGLVRAEVVWAALDCPSGIAAADPCRVIAWPQRRDGRKLTAGSALLGPDGEVLALAEAVWLTVPRPGQVRAAEAAPAAEAAGGAR